VFVATEPGLNHLEVFKVNVNSWEKFMEVCRELSEGKHEFKTLIIDTIDNLVMFCQEFVCAREGIKHPSDYDYGKGWSMVTQEFQRVMTKVSLMPYGLVMVGHSKTEEVKTKSKAYNKTTISVTGENRKIITSMADIILFMESDMDENGKPVGVIHCKPEIYFDAGDRSKRLPPEIVFPVDNPAVAFEKIKRCFTEEIVASAS
jgi:hypothetical protein